MKHGILLTVHDNIPVVKTMFRMLDDKRFTFYLLVDKKSRYLPSEFIPQLSQADVQFIPRININWGGYSQIAAELLLIEAALKDGQQYLHFLQGADLPLKTPDQMDSFFEQTSGIFIDIGSESSGFANYKVLCRHFFADCKLFRKNKIIKFMNHSLAYLQKPIIRFYKMYGHLYAGSATWSIPSDFAKYVIQSKAMIKKMYRYTLAADEVFIHTLCMNSEWCNLISEYGGVRLIDWANHEGNSPKTFTIADIDELSRAITNPVIMFSRKFSAEKDMQIVEYVFNRVSEAGHKELA